MKIDSHTIEVDGRSISTWYAQPAKRLGKIVAVTLHGAGESDSQRALPLAKDFEHSGIPVVSLDFYGHGKSVGSMNENSIAARVKQAYAAIEYWTNPDDQLILCGFSMSGHVVLRLAEQFGDRVDAIGLFCPAVYADQAENVTFGPEFSKIIRSENSWEHSSVFDAAEDFKGRSLVVIGAEDKVIPPEVIKKLAKSLAVSSADLRLKVIAGVDHALMTWLGSQDALRREMVRYLVGTV